MQKKNYQKELDKKIELIVSEKKVPRLFLHSCCAPCSSYVLEYLSEYFEITVFYYNPNIFPEAEFEKRIHPVGAVTWNSGLVVFFTYTCFSVS